jgi:glycosyltransferase involved in cell wall biosynthesis
VSDSPASRRSNTINLVNRRRTDGAPGPPEAMSPGRVALLIPCYNEESVIDRAVRDFRRALPRAEVFVYDNNSRDRTAEVARAAGATIRHEPRQGKGNVVRRMFADIEADVYVLVDGDATYSADSAPAMIGLLQTENLDMVVGCRVHEAAEAYRRGHRFGNVMFTDFVSHVFGKQFTDILSGYRVFSRRFVKSFPALSSGFEIETELTVHALELNVPVGEIETPYRARPEGSTSKLSTYKDGARILKLIVTLFKHEKPLAFFGALAAVLALLSVGLAVPIISEWLQIGLVPRFPTAILSAAIMILAFLSVTAGMILETVTRGRREMKRLVYLQIPRHEHR